MRTTSQHKKKKNRLKYCDNQKRVEVKNLKKLNCFFLLFFVTYLMLYCCKKAMVELYFGRIRIPLGVTVSSGFFEKSSLICDCWKLQSKDKFL